MTEEKKMLASSMLFQMYKEQKCSQKAMLKSIKKSFLKQVVAKCCILRPTGHSLTWPTDWQRMDTRTDTRFYRAQRCFVASKKESRTMVELSLPRTFFLKLYQWIFLSIHSSANTSADPFVLVPYISSVTPSLEKVLPLGFTYRACSNGFSHAPLHLYIMCSVRPSIGPSVCPSIHPYVQSVH